jgi:uncharacterized protein YjbI with pentapeptide repeats
MANSDHLNMLRQGVDAWNAWTKPDITPDLLEADLRGRTSSGPNLRVAHLGRTYLIGAHLGGANLIMANLSGANFSERWGCGPVDLGKSGKRPCSLTQGTT